MNKKITNAILIYKTLAVNSFNQRYAYMSGVWIQILGGVLFVFMQGSLWRTLIQTGYAQVTLKEMMSFVVINAFVGYATNFRVTSIISDRVRDGMIAMDLILPVGLKGKLFFENIGANLFDLAFSGIPGLFTGALLCGVVIPVGNFNLVFFSITVLLGVAISYHMIYLFGLSAFWLINPWYIPILVGGLTKLFGGSVIPLWFYPHWLLSLCAILPFRFISYEPIQIYLGRYGANQAMNCVLMQILWLVIFMVTEKLVWLKANKKIFVQGG
ncbi:MAG: ABC-2 family transporter protein [Clostridium sp.]|jgi:ABC-2 type transport system permease protein|nr:ABC-2 family transporter protein [Clostridium sp.]